MCGRPATTFKRLCVPSGTLLVRSNPSSIVWKTLAQVWYTSYGHCQVYYTSYHLQSIYLLILNNDNTLSYVLFYIVHIITRYDTSRTATLIPGMIQVVPNVNYIWRTTCFRSVNADNCMVRRVLVLIKLILIFSKNRRVSHLLLRVTILVRRVSYLSQNVPLLTILRLNAVCQCERQEIIFNGHTCYRSRVYSKISFSLPSNTASSYFNVSVTLFRGNKRCNEISNIGTKTDLRHLFPIQSTSLNFAQDRLIQMKQTSTDPQTRKTFCQGIPTWLGSSLHGCEHKWIG